MLKTKKTAINYHQILQWTWILFMANHSEKQKCRKIT